MVMHGTLTLRHLSLWGRRGHRSGWVRDIVRPCRPSCSLPRSSSPVQSTSPRSEALCSAGWKNTQQSVREENHLWHLGHIWGVMLCQVSAVLIFPHAKGTIKRWFSKLTVGNKWFLGWVFFGISLAKLLFYVSKKTSLNITLGGNFPSPY